jgi:hypothetical protein
MRISPQMLGAPPLRFSLSQGWETTKIKPQYLEKAAGIFWLLRRM